MSAKDVKKESREQRDRIKRARREAIDVVQQLGTDCLAARRRLGIPDPDETEWGERMKKFHIGLNALALAHLAGDPVETAPDTLRRWLTHPLLDRPATDDDLYTYIDLLETTGALGDAA